ncbi:MAG: hypothetical protein ACI4BC_09300 [Muribaculaceae bacterium]
MLDVASVQKLATPQGVVAGISPQGDYILLTNAQNQGLIKFDLSTGKTTVVTDVAGAGYDVKISDDGKDIVYYEQTIKEGLRYRSVKQINLATGEMKQLAEASREVNPIAEGKIATSVLKKSKKAPAPVLSILNSQLMITQNGQSRVLSPNGEEYSYIWPSLSPDGTKVLYYVCDLGAFVSDLKGNIIASLGFIQAPQWYGNNLVVGMNDIDDGQVVISSSIVVTDLSGISQTLTDPSVIAMYPCVNALGDKIAFTTSGGEAYIININVK